MNDTDGDPTPIQGTKLVAIGAHSDLARTTVSLSNIRRLADMLDVAANDGDSVLLAAIKAVDAANKSEFNDDGDNA